MNDKDIPDTSANPVLSIPLSRPDDEAALGAGGLRRNAFTAGGSEAALYGMCDWILSTETSDLLTAFTAMAAARAIDELEQLMINRGEANFHVSGR